MRLLLHTCCAGCLLGGLSRLKRDGWEVVCFFFNPNIHPLLEFRKRIRAMKVLRDQMKGRLEMMVCEEYGLKRYLREVAPDGEKNCARCYEMRLRETARRAGDEGFDAFSTTLLGSHEQDHGLIREIGEKVARGTGVTFVYADLRGGMEEGLAEAKRRKLYRQQYCGCIFSEEERYRDTRAEMYRGGG